VLDVGGAPVVAVVETAGSAGGHTISSAATIKTVAKTMTTVATTTPILPT
jgi:hypothetical protein